MSRDVSFESVDHITLGSIGPPGQRTFLLQARQGQDIVTLLLEKQHAISLGETAKELLTRIGMPDPPVSWTAESMAMDESEEPLWKVGEMGVGYEEERDAILLLCREQVDENETAATAQFWITKSQLSALGSCGLVVAAQGRPLCPFCTLPIDPEGHECPAVNGHRQTSLDSGNAHD